MNPLPHSVSYGQYIQVSTYYLEGFSRSAVPVGYHRVDVYSYYPGSDGSCTTRSTTGSAWWSATRTALRPECTSELVRVSSMAVTIR